MSPKILIGLPAYNESKIIGDVVSRLFDKGYSNVLVVDDASSDDTAKKARNVGAEVIVHEENKGAGGATKTILRYAREEGFDYLVLMDGDGQHDPRDIKKLLGFKDEFDFVLGVRDFKASGVPFTRRVANWIGNVVTWVFFGKYVRDSQSGFKLLNKAAIGKVRISFDRYEFCSELIGEAKRHGLRLKQVPIRTIYTDHSKSKGQSVFEGFKMVWRMMKKQWFGKI